MNKNILVVGKSGISAGVWMVAALLVCLAPSAGAQPEIGIYHYNLASPPGTVEAPCGVAFHPDGSYALIISRENFVYVFDWATEAITSYNLEPSSGVLEFDDLNFSPDGSFALLVGRHGDTTDEGVVFKFMDSAYREGRPIPEVVFECTAARREDLFVGVEFPWDGGMPVVLGRSEDNLIASLRKFDPVTEDFTADLTATNTVAGATDLAYVNNEFGEPGILVVCGIFGTAAYYRTSVGGVWEWRGNLADAGMGNFSSIAARPGGDYALAIDWPGRRVHRFEAGMFYETSAVPHFPTQGIWSVGFQDDGERALIVGRALGNPLVGTILEFRHDHFSQDDLANVGIPNFSEAPFFATTNTYIEAAGFRPGCDGGLLVVYDHSLFDGFGFVVSFQIINGVSCDQTSAINDEVLGYEAKLWDAAPNPFNPHTIIAFEIPVPQAVSLCIFDVAGRLVRKLITAEPHTPRRHEIVWNGRDDTGRQVASGTYFYRLEAGSFSETKRMVLLK